MWEAAGGVPGPPLLSSLPLDTLQSPLLSDGHLTPSGSGHGPFFRHRDPQLRKMSSCLFPPIHHCQELPGTRRGLGRD